MKNYFISWFYSEQANDESYYPSVGGSSSSAGFQYVYWRCIYVLYQSAKITNADTIDEWLFFTNVENLPTVDGVNFKEYFEENQIKVIRLELTRKTPKDWYGAWRNQFYLFDVLEAIKDMEGNHLILDSDCVITHSLKPLYEEIEKEGLLTLTIDYDVARDVNGCSVTEMRKLYQKFFSQPYPEELLYTGGELIAMTDACIRELLEIFYPLWEKNYALYEKKEKKLNEEAHTLSLCYYYMGKQNGLGNHYIKRMWTDMLCDTVEKGDAELPIWHLPAEKKFGFYELFQKLSAHPQMDGGRLYQISSRCMKLTASKRARKINWYYRYGKQKIKRIFSKKDKG